MVTCVNGLFAFVDGRNKLEIPQNLALHNKTGAKKSF